MKLSLLATTSVLALVGLVSTGPTPVFRQKQNDDDYERRLRLESEFASLFTNTSARDPAYKEGLVELNALSEALAGAKVTTDPAHQPHGRHYCTIDPSKILPKIDGGIGISHNPTRSMKYSDSSNYNRNGWTHDFGLTKNLSGLNFLSVWDALDPHRINVADNGTDLTKSRWTYRDYIPAYTIVYPMTPVGLATLKLHLPVVVDDVQAVRELAQDHLHRMVNIEVIQAGAIAGGFEGNLLTSRPMDFWLRLGAWMNASSLAELGSELRSRGI
ncbi:hypothetical protein EDD11_009563 [Mortierella claussenii]|nr:hypothetical protein EDD11_009563 [Mortierella claussenii]